MRISLERSKYLSFHSSHRNRTPEVSCSLLGTTVSSTIPLDCVKLPGWIWVITRRKTLEQRLDILLWVDLVLTVIQFKCYILQGEVRYIRYICYPKNTTKMNSFIIAISNCLVNKFCLNYVIHQERVLKSSPTSTIIVLNRFASFFLREKTIL